MKKISLKIIYTLLLLLPVITYAYGIENFYINATLESDGDLRVQEYFNMNGDFNGMERILNFANENNYSFRPELESYGTSKLYDGSDIEINEVRAVSISSNFNFKDVEGKKFKEVSSAEVGDYGVYTLYTDSEGASLKIFLPDRKNKAFYIDYTIKNIAVAHNDVGELYWQIPINGLREDIENLEVTVKFPKNENEFRVWAHGPLHGSVSKSGNTILKAKINGVSAYSKIDVRSTFDLNVIKDTSKYSHVFALDKILNYENSAAEQANYERIQTEYLNQEKALNTITTCYKTPRRTCYNEAKRLINLIQDEEIKKEYTEKLNELETLVINYEETTAKEAVANAEEYEKYYWYQNAYNVTIILTNEELKESLLERLDVVKEKITKEEEASYKNLKTFSIALIATTLAMVIYFYNIHIKIKYLLFDQYISSLKGDLYLKN